MLHAPRRARPDDRHHGPAHHRRRARRHRPAGVAGTGIAAAGLVLFSTTGAHVLRGRQPAHGAARARPGHDHAGPGDRRPELGAGPGPRRRHVGRELLPLGGPLGGRLRGRGRVRHRPRSPAGTARRVPADRAARVLPAPRSLRPLRGGGAAGASSPRPPTARGWPVPRRRTSRRGPAAWCRTRRS